MGTFVISKRANGEFQFNLKAGNGQVILASEGYTTMAACENGIESVRVNSLEDSQFDRLTSKNNKYYFLLRARNGQAIGSSEMYESAASRDNGIESVKKNAFGATLQIVPNTIATESQADSGKPNSEESRHVQVGIGLQNELAYESFQRFLNEYKISERLLEIALKEKEFRASAAQPETSENLPDLSADLQEIKNLVGLVSVEQRLPSKALSELKTNKLFQEAFANNSEMKAVVVSIDIRKSTELMLKSRSPRQYAEFITKLSSELSNVITSNFGIYDKFTGDGILAFFPDFYSGKDSILHALRACDECHAVFREHYEKYKSIFTVFLKSIGLGIGIDYGEVTLVNRGAELTVVGIPVVYACRMSSAPPNATWLNLPAFDFLIENCGNMVHYEEVEVNLKHEGPALAYAIQFSKNMDKVLTLPEWALSKE
ncbi:DUF1508 domain-containing protein [Dyadobacter fermentans]|uniref:Guanylate cyclase domain-containing protein n=1 Tax=Dyadobacter fermentans (strain ATCC 700827 / DSM 18053 / CIP 107007 / KCTC 52180 / NS114) TaxID=471854 RepID=C6W3A8_DYAFD|nr:DUF1508 domain-containing protein [Dyadobacter fermentans]ACT92212.1 protein of unknown function DUF1508 [Dyadobacter fermentans DSM 18053]